MTGDATKLTFEQWMHLVEQEIQRLTGQPGFGIKDVADFLYRDRYDEGYDPRAVALEALQEDGLWATMFEDWDDGEDGDDDDEAN